MNLGVGWDFFFKKSVIYSTEGAFESTFVLTEGVCRHSDNQLGYASFAHGSQNCYQSKWHFDCHIRKESDSHKSGCITLERETTSCFLRERPPRKYQSTTEWKRSGHKLIGVSTADVELDQLPIISMQNGIREQLTVYRIQLHVKLNRSIHKRCVRDNKTSKNVGGGTQEIALTSSLVMSCHQHREA